MDIIIGAEVLFLVHCGVSYWEVELRYASGRRKRIDFLLSVAKELNITSRLNGTKKLGTWLNSSDGLKYLNRNFF
jgi:hypothetical protein